MKRITGIFLFLLLNAALLAQDISRRTITYYDDDSTRLEMDLFLPSQVEAGEAVPLLIFVHGGGFSNGNRNSGYKLCEAAAREGIASATISYTLYMKGKSFSCDGILTEKVRAIQIAANQVWLATGYFIENHEKLRIDTTNIFISGSSAGAEAVLHAAFWDRQKMALYPAPLSPAFKYAGVISGAGALMDIQLINHKTKIPVMLTHGTCDPLVPYATAPHHYCKPTDPGYLMLFGALTIYQQLIGLNESCLLMSYNGGGHEHSFTPFDTEIPAVLWFIKHLLYEEKFQIHRIFQTGKSCESADSD